MTKYKPEFRIKELKPRKKTINVIVRKDNVELPILNDFLSLEVRNYSKEILKELDNVLNNEKENGEFNGDSFGLVIGKTITTIFDILVDVDECFEIETNELRHLVDIFIEVMKHFKVTGKLH